MALLKEALLGATPLVSTFQEISSSVVLRVSMLHAIHNLTQLAPLGSTRFVNDRFFMGMKFEYFFNLSLKYLTQPRAIFLFDIEVHEVMKFLLQFASLKVSGG